MYTEIYSYGEFDSFDAPGAKEIAQAYRSILDASLENESLETLKALKYIVLAHTCVHKLLEV